MSYLTTYQIVDVATGDVICADAMPTPLLLSVGHRATEAWCDYKDERHEYWRVRDDDRDPPGTEYRRVWVRVVDPDPMP